MSENEMQTKVKLNHNRSMVLFIHPWSDAEEECLMKERLIQNQLIQEELIKEHSLLVRQPAVLIVCKRVYKSFLKEFKTSKGKMSFYVTRF